MARHTTEGLAALCLAANGFVASNFAEERMRDGRITHIVCTFEHGKHVVRVHSGIVPGHYTRGTSALTGQDGETDARAQALQSFWAHELDQKAKRPGDAVVLEEACF
jgi:hypothetical protein